jgi:hypothetical protein
MKTSLVLQYSSSGIYTSAYEIRINQHAPEIYALQFYTKFSTFQGKLHNDIYAATLEINRGKASLCFKPLLLGNGTGRLGQTTNIYFENVSP